MRFNFFERKLKDPAEMYRLDGESLDFKKEFERFAECDKNTKEEYLRVYEEYLKGKDVTSEDELDLLIFGIQYLSKMDDRLKLLNKIMEMAILTERDIFQGTYASAGIYCKFSANSFLDLKSRRLFFDYHNEYFARHSFSHSDSVFLKDDLKVQKDLNNYAKRTGKNVKVIPEGDYFRTKLYDSQHKANTTFLFDKIPGFQESWKGKVMLRREVVPMAFFAWKKAYESGEYWLKRGYDYVPVEPIVFFRVNKDYTFDVYTRILDENTVEAAFPDLNKKLLKDLHGLRICHSHAHSKNFCVRYFRNKDGSIDKTKKPRAYIIDMLSSHLY